MTATSEVVIKFDTLAAELESIMSELEDFVYEIVDGWYQDTRIDWEGVWDRLDGIQLNDGRVLDIRVVTSPVQVALKNRVIRRRWQG
jgi:hypothetical protein